MAVDMAEVFNGARAAGFPVDGMVHATEKSPETTELSVRINKGTPVPTLDDTSAGKLAAGKYNDCWLFLKVHHSTRDGRPYFHVYSNCADSERREDAPGGGNKGSEGPDLARAIQEAIEKQGLTKDGKLKPCWEARTARDARRDIKDVVPVGETWTEHDEQMAEEGEAAEQQRSLPMAVIVGGAAILLLLAIVGAGAAAHLGPFATAAATNHTGPAAPATAKAFGTSLDNSNAELKFDHFVLGACPPQDAKYTAPTFTGGWHTAVMPGAGNLQAANMVGLPTSPFAVAMNGTIDPTGLLDVRGDSNIENMRLRVMVPRPPAGPLRMPVNVTGTADVALHFTGQPAIGTVTGDCNATYQVTGTFAAP